MLDLKDCTWTDVAVERGAVVFAFWTEWPVVKYQKVQWVADGDRYIVDGYFN